MTERVLIRGRVVDAAGRPVAGALVSVAWGTAPTPEIARLSNDAGEFQVALPPGRFRIEAETPDGRSGSVDVDGGSGNDIVLRIAAPEPGRNGGHP